jgi:hypothetical protein
VTHLLPNTCTIQRSAQTAATTGEAQGAPATVTAGVRCNLQLGVSSEDRRYERETGVRAGVCYFPVGTDVRTQDRLTTFAGGGVAGMSSVVVKVVGPPSDGVGRGYYLVVPVEQETT